MNDHVGVGLQHGFEFAGCPQAGGGNAQQLTHIPARLGSGQGVQANELQAVTFEHGQGSVTPDGAAGPLKNLQGHGIPSKYLR